MTRRKDLPDFRKPPVAETVLSLQFEPISGLTTAHIGLLWARFRADFPTIEEHEPLPTAIEEFGRPSLPPVHVSIEQDRPLPRVWFISKTKTELIQVQSNRFIHNWRRYQGIEPYPHYDVVNRPNFNAEVATFQKFLEDESLGPLKINQCEVAYVNHIEQAGVWETHSQFDKVFSVWNGGTSGSFLPKPEDVAMQVRFVIPDGSGKPVGRLHVVAHPAWRRTDQMPIFVLNLTARGEPLGDGVNGAFAFLDLARDWIVKGFAELTRPEMHRVWERIQEDDTNR